MQQVKNVSIHVMPVLAATMLLFLPARTALGMPEGSPSVSTSFEFSEGDYGTDQTSDSYRVPISLDYRFTERFGLVLDISYIYQSDSSTVALGGGRYPMHGSSTGGSGGSGGMTGQGPHGPGSGEPQPGMGDVTGTESQRGFGDIILTADYTLLPEGAKSPMVRTLIYAKVPTADEDKGLGSGAFDYGVGLSLSRGFGQWLVVAEAMFIAPGSKGDFEPDNYWSWLAAANHPVTDRLFLGVELAGATAPFEGSDDALDLQFTASYRMSKRSSVGGYVATGLTDGSADLGIGVYGLISF